MDGEAQFRRLALELPDTVEGSHMGAADFRLNGRIFATLAYVARGQATLMLSVEQQQSFLSDLRPYAEPAPGGWGRMGMTLLRIDAPEEIVRGALLTAYNHIKSKQEARRRKPRPAMRAGPRKPRIAP